MDDLFEQIEKDKLEMPKLKTIQKKVIVKRNLNFYQTVALVVMAIMFVVGIILGNVFPACGESSSLFSTCTRTEYNLSLTLIVWASSFLFCLFVYGLGHGIALLTEISEQLKQLGK